MANSTAVQQKRRQLVADGVDPFALLAEVLVDNDRLRDQVSRLQCIVQSSGIGSSSTTPQ